MVTFWLCTAWTEAGVQARASSVSGDWSGGGLAWVEWRDTKKQEQNLSVVSRGDLLLLPAACSNRRTADNSEVTGEQK